MSEKANINCSDAGRTSGRSWLWASTEEFSSDEREWFFCARFEVRSGFNDGARLFMGCSTSGLFANTTAIPTSDGEQSQVAKPLPSPPRCKDSIAAALQNQCPYAAVVHHLHHLL
ncbi:hypothetical protein OROMI_020082 [Orobanche minor]